jgi:ribosomal protein S18 acetylase RimI-like enzyme
MTSDIQAIEQGRERFLDLLRLADPSVELVQQYLAEGHLFVLYEKGEACGVVHLLPQTVTIMEVKNIAVKEEAQGCGYGKRLLQYALDFCHRQGYEKVRVGTGNSSINNLAFYQKAGFRFLEIRRNFFTEHYDEPIFEHGIHCRDMIVLEADFADQSVFPQPTRLVRMGREGENHRETGKDGRNVFS